ncbi:rho GTPase-activating protein 18 isoform X3 [Notothenia coriiceps]|uniref:Rho GTPase-activating protein 18 isoform X3 n=1 Tax=Notothenia coriiceps TaxID=8208 RepID=A0A6I9PZB8_9TELE|nr:PREDICTED: rho GTPase-activating protein 18 isoform X3 [Notothenia coriiceps]
MSRQQQESQGVVLTGYHSNAELLPKIGPLAPVSCPPAQVHEPAMPRCDKIMTGHYTFQQNQNTHLADESGPSATEGGTKTSTTDPPSLLNPSAASSPWSQPSFSPKPGSSPRHSPSPKSRPRPRTPCLRSNSQDSLDELEMDDYWKEVENITSSGGGSGRGDAGGEGEVPEEEQQKIPEEGEQEEAWLTEAGLARLFDDSLAADQDQEEDSAVFLSTLTRSQAAAVERRVTTLQQTLLRRRNRQHVPDVRDIFRPPEKHEQPIELKAESENGQKDITSAETETELNVEVAFSEQALTYRDNHQRAKVTASPNSPDDKLPNFKLLRDKTGQTRIGDLSPLDMKKVRRLVLVESTALFDTAGIDLKADKPVKVKTKESGLFGVPLATLLEQDHRRAPGTKVPLILQRLINHIEEEGLDTEGLLRIPGAATRVKLLCQEFETSFYDGTFPWQQLKQHDAASLLKLFIRELPLPLLTVEYLNAFFAVNKLPTKKQQLQALNLLILLLPETNRDTLKALVEFFHRVIDHQDKNKMTLNNVSVVMAPNIFMFKGFRSKVTEQQEFSMATSTAHIVRLLIRYQNLLWTIPKFIMTQVRQQNMESHRKQYKERAVRKLLKKMTTDKPSEKAVPEESSQGFIRVQAPQFSKVSMAVQLTGELQAADVLTRFLSQDSSVAVEQEELCLYEIGGNIKERCLDGETYMKDLFELNPTAEWVIRAVHR